MSQVDSTPADQASEPAPPLRDAAPPSRLRSLARQAKQQAFHSAACWMSGLFGPRRKQAFGILMYHRVTDAAGQPTWNVTPDRLREQLAGLLARGYAAWPLRRVLQLHGAGQAIPRRTFVVTFDDGYENNLTQALPILKELQVPATIFLATQYLDSSEPFPSDDWKLAGDPSTPVDSWRPLTTDQCRELQACDLIELGAHTHSHGDFRGRPAALRKDLATCCQVLQERFGVERPTFAFPYGTKHTGFSGGALSEAAREVGVACALTTESELVGPQRDPFDWGRFTAEQHDSAASLAGKLGGWFGIPRLRRYRNGTTISLLHSA